MKIIQKIRKKRDFSNNFGFSLAEIIVVLMIISILTVIAIPKLEIPVKKSLKTIKNYSQIGLNSLKNSGYLAKEFNLLQVKISIRAYLLAAKNIFMSESYIPSTAADLNRFTPVNGCYLTKKENFTNTSKDCVPLLNKLNISSWETKNRLFKINMISSETQLNILAIPYIKDDKGIFGCYDSKTGRTKINIIESKNLNKKLLNC